MTPQHIRLRPEEIDADVRKRGEGREKYDAVRNKFIGAGPRLSDDPDRDWTKVHLCSHYKMAFRDKVDLARFEDRADPPSSVARTGSVPHVGGNITPPVPRHLASVA